MQNTHWPYHSQEELDAVERVLSSGKTNYWTGNECRAFEQEYAEAVGTQYAVAVMNGTVALEAALHALGIGPGDEVITTCRTFIASASCIMMLGATPVLADVSPESQNITAETIEPLITPKTKAIIAVHLAGWPCNMDAIMDLARRNHLKVIEDCAQAHGATYKGRQVGAWGDVAAFSFCQDKIITTGGEGGMVTTNDPDIWEKIWTLKDHGKGYATVHHQEHPPGFRWLHDSFGTNWRMTEVQAAIGRAQLRKLPEWLRTRSRNASILSQALADIPALRLSFPPEHIGHAHYKYYAFVRPEHLKPDWSRDRIMQEIMAQGVPCFSGSCPEIHREKAFEKAGVRPTREFPVAKRLGETSLMFLVHPTLSEADMHKAARIIQGVMQQASQSSEKARDNAFSEMVESIDSGVV